MAGTETELIDKLRDYKMPQLAVELLASNPPLVLTGATGSGKDAIEEYIQAVSDWRHVVTHTTRQPRPGEKTGVEYWFVSPDEMLEMVNRQAFVEVKFLHNHQISGSSIAAYKSVIDSGHKPLLRIDVQGIEELHRHASGIRPFFILPPDFPTWMQRLEGRGHMSHVEKIKRMHSAEVELETALLNERFILVVNDEVPRVAKEILDGVTDIAAQQRNRELAQRLIDHIKAF